MKAVIVQGENRLLTIILNAKPVLYWARALFENKCD